MTCRMIDIEPAYSECGYTENFKEFEFMKWNHLCTTMTVSHKGTIEMTWINYTVFINSKPFHNGKYRTTSKLMVFFSCLFKLLKP